MNCTERILAALGRRQRRRGMLVAGFLALAVLLPAQTSVYWDTNGFWGFGSSNSGGTWDQNFSENWSASQWGWFSPTRSWSSIAAGDKIAVFSAGTNATGTFSVNVRGDITDVAGLSFEEGTVTVGGAGRLNLTGAPTIDVSAAEATISAELAGSVGVTKTGSGALTLSGNNTFSGGFTLNSGSVLVQHSNALGSGAVTLAGGTLTLSSISVAIGTLNITGDTTIDFSGTSTLSVTNLDISAGATLTIVNWNDAADYFFARNWNGAIFDTTAVAPMNQVVFRGFGADKTRWQSFDRQITPVPEPSVYGAILIGLVTAVLLTRRFLAPVAAG